MGQRFVDGRVAEPDESSTPQGRPIAERACSQQEGSGADGELGLAGRG